MKYRLIAIDFDGTFLDDSHFKKSLEYFNKLKEIEQEIVFASGRATAGIIELLKRLGINDRCRYIIGHNGAEIYDLKEEKIIYQQKLDDNLAIGIIKLLKDNGFNKNPIGIHKWNKLYVNEIDDKVDLERRVNFIDLIKINDISEYPKDKIKIMVFAESRERTNKTYSIIKNSEYGPLVAQARSLDFLNEIMPKGVNKFNALLKLLEILNIKKEEVIAFGNAENDIEMVLNVGLGYAMKNSESHLLDVAKNITKYTNNEFGVEREIMRILDIK